MGDQTELRMNLAAVKRADPYAKEIVETSAHVAFYTFNYEGNEWEKTDVEGAFFVYKRTAEPYHSIFINNRLNTKSLVEPITADLELQSRPPFLLYRNERSRIRGFWFYNKDELKKVAELINSLIKVTNVNVETPRSQHQVADQHLMKQQQFVSMIEGAAQNNKNASLNVNIFSMLSKAQEDFNNSQLQNTKPVASVTKTGEQLPQKTSAVNINNHSNGSGPHDGVTSQSVMNFFASAKPTVQQSPQPMQRHNHNSNGNASADQLNVALKAAIQTPQQQAPAGGPPLLQRIMSNPVHTVEQIEKQQRTVTPQEVVPCGVKKDAGFNWTVPPPKLNGTPAGENQKPDSSTNGNNKNGKNTANNSSSWAALFGQNAAPPCTETGILKMLSDAENANGVIGTNIGPTTVSNVKPALMPPTMFQQKRDQKEVRVTSKQKPDAVGDQQKLKQKTDEEKASRNNSSLATDLQIKPEPLTQSQLLQAISYLIKNDPDFMRKLHEAYLRSFAEMVSL